jgi:hypothetical protein
LSFSCSSWVWERWWCICAKSIGNRDGDV